MKLVGIVSTATLSLLLGIAAPVYAQQEQQDVFHAPVTKKNGENTT